METEMLLFYQIVFHFGALLFSTHIGGAVDCHQCVKITKDQSCKEPGSMITCGIGKCTSAKVTAYDQNQAEHEVTLLTCVADKKLKDKCYDDLENLKEYVDLSAYQMEVKSGHVHACPEDYCNTEKLANLKCGQTAGGGKKKDEEEDLRFNENAIECHECASDSDSDTINSTCPGSGSNFCLGKCAFGEVVVATPQFDYKEDKISISHCLSNDLVPEGCYKNPTYIGAYLGVDDQLTVSSGYAYVCSTALCNNGHTEGSSAECEGVEAPVDYGRPHYIGGHGGTSAHGVESWGTTVLILAELLWVFTVGV